MYLMTWVDDGFWIQAALRLELRNDMMKEGRFEHNLEDGGGEVAEVNENVPVEELT